MISLFMSWLMSWPKSEYRKMNMDRALSRESSVRTKSISTRFSFTLIVIVAMFMTAFAVIASLFTIDRISGELDNKLSNYLGISSVGLQAPLWNLDHGIVEGYLDSLMLDETIVYANVLSGDGTVISRARPDVKGQDFDGLASSGDYTARQAQIMKDGNEIGRLQLVVSRVAVRDEIAINIGAIMAITFVVLATITTASVLISRRYVARPLADLQRSATAIGEGDLQTEIDVSGRDEIGVLARAFDGMRNSIRSLVAELKQTNEELEDANRTLEERVVKRTNEVVATQQKLVDAIESTSEGFAFYDARDLLVLHNTQYEQLFYSGSDVKIEPGKSFEQILRLAADDGLMSSDGEDSEEFIRKRIAQHRNPGAPFLQHRGDGKWIQISERKTSDGGTVAVFSDITELKEREADLTEKSAALQHLSNQLAKYLSPQVYESIFQGRQEVKVTSSRKKLTVFFSDIEGFTETAERMESEELTSLLNNYLTEMSQIALDHGATIDKYMGDAILAFFGDPESRGVKQDAIACVKMAIAMGNRMHELQNDWRKAGIERPLKCRTGIHTDYCTVGNFGSESRMDYTIIGRAVNTAARLESAAEPGKILISYETFSQVSDQIRCESRGQVNVKGMSHPINVYAVIMDDEQTRKNLIRSALPNFLLETDLDSLSGLEREQVKTLLQDVLGRLSPRDSS
jgi:class 3 adenylate cyclase/HAMP domain-containing protein